MNQDARGASRIRRGRCERRSRRIKNIGVAIARTWRRKVRVVENIKDLHAELDVEILRDSADVIILEDGEVQTGHTGADQDVSSGIAAQIETLR